VLYASCLAAAGLEPLIFIVPGHAFSGYALADGSPAMQQPVVHNPNEVAAMFASGVFQPVETTTLCVGPAESFDAAIARHTPEFLAGLPEFGALINVVKSREAGVRPIPARRIVNSVLEIEIETGTPAAHAMVGPSPTNDVPPADRVDRGRLESFDGPPRIRKWLNSLLDLSATNPLVNMKPGAGVFELTLEQGMLAALEDRMMTGGLAINLMVASRVPQRVIDNGTTPQSLATEMSSSGGLYWPSVDQFEALVNHEVERRQQNGVQLSQATIRQQVRPLVGDHYAALLDKSLAGLKRRARDIETQTGTNNLFLTIGSVVWSEPGTTARLRAPLFLIPVRVSGTADTSIKISADEGAEITPNYCLLEKLRQTFNFDASVLEMPELDEHGIDVDRMLADVRGRLSEANIASVVVEETSHLAVLNFANFRLWKDMRDHWRVFMGNEVVRHLVERPFESFEDPAVAATAGQAPVDVLCPTEVDESQLEAVRWAVEGRSFVIEGPPGAGKSQTITNLLAACIAANKRVLFVAQKQPALEVVKKRLRQAGMMPFCIDLHDKGSKPEQIRKQLRDALDFAGVDQEAEWADLMSQLAADETALIRYRDVIHAKNSAGYSAWSAQQEFADLGEGASISIPPALLDADFALVPAIRNSLLQLPLVAGVSALDAKNPWALCDQIDFSEIDQADLALTVGRLQENLDAFEHLPESDRAVLATLTTPASLADVAETVALWKTLSSVPEATLVAVGTESWLESTRALVAGIDAFATTYADITRIFQRSVFTADLAQMTVAGADAAAAGPLSRGKKTRTFDLILAPYLLDSTLRSVEEWMNLLGRVTPARAEVEAINASARRLDGVGVRPEWTILDDEDAQHLRRRVTELPAETQQLLDPAMALVHRSLADGWSPDASTLQLLRDADQTWQRLSRVVGTSQHSLIRWLDGRTFIEAWRASNPAWLAAAPRFLSLQRWCELTSTVAPLRTAGLDRSAEELLSGKIPLDQGFIQFRRGLVRAALSERLEAGRIDQFDGLAQDRRVKTFVDRSSRQRELMRTVIPRSLVQKRPFSPGTRVGDYGSLERELSKVARRLSIRKLIERYGQILPHLSPCFLMSPDSVAKFLPPGAIEFDLVVFDEASQIEVAQAIGVMGRAKAVVVVGDSNQMPPSTFGASAASDADEDAIESDVAMFEDLESILSECVESNLPRLYLKCHYRSRYEELISFSNAAFYESKLTTFPSPSAGFGPIKWRRIEGQFDRTSSGELKGTNSVEAQAIVDEIKSRLEDPETSSQSICVVTLNIQQQKLIRKLLEECGSEAIRTLFLDDSDGGLIVRNLESVQGDERDVVMISIAFSPLTSARQGEVGRLPLNFGPLNKKGGERRLNVAVTRARSEVVVFCSFDPEQMKLAEDPARGLLLLKQYLSIARDGVKSSGDLVSRTPTPPDHHRRAIARALEDRGLTVTENVGLSKFRVDLAVGLPESTGWTVAVLLDGPGWAERSTVFDRDALPAQVLKMMGWPKVVRVWLPSWIQEPNRVINDIVELVRPVPEPVANELSDEPARMVLPPEAAPAAAPTMSWLPPTMTTSPPPSPPRRRGPPGWAPPVEVHIPSPPGPAPVLSAAESVVEPISTLAPDLTRVTETEVSRASVDDEALSERESIFVPAPAGIVGDKNVLDTIGDRASKEQVKRVIAEIVAAESPIHVDRLGKLVAARFGLTVVRQGRIDDIAHLAPGAQKHRSALGVFVWDESLDAETWRKFRRTPLGSDRKLEHVAPEEILNAMQEVLVADEDMEFDGMLRVVAEIFGFARLSAPVRAHLTRVFNWAQRSGRLD
jgi:hypothetical protein